MPGYFSGPWRAAETFDASVEPMKLVITADWIGFPISFGRSLDLGWPQAISHHKSQIWDV